MITTQVKLNILQEIAEDDTSLDRMLDKLLHVIREQYQKRLKRYEADLKEFEIRYEMPSHIFYRKFEAGTLGDAMDFFEWSGIYELWQDMQHKIKRLELS